jgi:hypothetical protein
MTALITWTLLLVLAAVISVAVILLVRQPKALKLIISSTISTTLAMPKY